MSDDETANETNDEERATDQTDEVTVESLSARLEELQGRLDTAETEPELDEIEAGIDGLESDIESADLPEPADEDEDDPVETLEDDIESLEADIEDQRGPYASEVVERIDDVRDEIASTEWTEKGEAELIDGVDEFVESVNDSIDSDVSLTNEGTDVPDRLTSTLENAVTAVDEVELDPDDDADTIGALIEAVESLESTVDDAQEWDDLTVREQLQAVGYYDVLDHIKDFPPEWHALKVHEKRGNVDMVLLALETFESDFMEEHCLEALQRMGSEEALEPMLARAEKRDKPGIRILGKIGIADPDVVETLLDYVDSDNDPLLQKATFKALGEMGADEALQPLANKLAAENAEIRSHAARSIGLLGDTRAIEPLADVLADDEEDTVRASAAWALNQIGTEEALEAVAAYSDDRAYLVQAEAEKAI